MKRLISIVIAIIVVIGGGIVAYRQILPSAGDQQGVRYATAEVRRGDLTVGVTARGMLNPTHGGQIQTPYPRGPVSFDFSWNFQVAEIYVKEGDPVKQGDPILQLRASQMEPRIQEMEDELRQKQQNLSDRLGVPVSELQGINPARGITLVATIDGRISGLEISEGDSVDQGKPIAKIVEDSRWVMTAKLTPWEFSLVGTGDRLLVRFPEFAGVLEATVAKVNPNPVPQSPGDLAQRVSGTTSNESLEFIYRVTLEGKNPGLVRPGMQGEVGFPPQGDTGSLTDLAAKSTWFRYYAGVDSYGREERVISTASGIVTEVFIEEMEMVKAGDPIVSLSGEETQLSIERDLEQIRQLETQIQQIRAFTEELTVTAPMDGNVAQIEVQEGQQIEPWYYIGSIYNPGKMQMWVQVDDVDVLHVQPGALVQVTLDALPGERFGGRVMNVSTSGRDMSGLAFFDVWIEVEGGPEVRPGMQAEAYIEAGHAQDVLLIPLEAIFQEEREYLVEILESDGSTKIVPIQVGLMGEFEAEVKSGLEEGQTVITGSTTDLLPSRNAPDTILPINRD